MKRDMEDWYGLVEVVVNKMIKQNRFLYRFKDDLIGEGTLGLIKGIETYDPERGVKKCSYYSMKIRGFVKNYIKREVRLARDRIDINNIDPSVPGVEEELIAKEDREEERGTSLVDLLEPVDELNRRIYHELILDNYITQRELAEEFNVNEKVVESRKARLIKALRKKVTNNLIGGSK